MILLALLANATWHFASGNLLYESCIGSGAQQFGCQQYVLGVLDMISFDQSVSGERGVCLPDGVDSAQLVDIIVKRYREHPEVRHYTAASEIWGVMHKTFPCPRKK